MLCRVGREESEPGEFNPTPPDEAAGGVDPPSVITWPPQGDASAINADLQLYLLGDPMWGSVACRAVGDRHRCTRSSLEPCCHPA